MRWKDAWEREKWGIPHLYQKEECFNNLQEIGSGKKGRKSLVALAQISTPQRNR